MQHFEHGGNLYAAARQTGANLSEYLDFSANINPLGIPTSVRQALAMSLDSIIHYPDTEAAMFKQAVSQHYRVPVETITAGNGAVELLYVLCHVIKPRRVLIPAPAFSEYERAARAARAEIEYFFLQSEAGFAVAIEEIISALPTVDMVFLGNPNNPTGVLVENRQIETLLAAAKECNVTVVVDESFLDFLPEDSMYTCRPLLRKYPNLFILHSLTKFYAMPGLRLGFALTNPDLTGLLHLGKDPWNVNCLAQIAGVTALNDSDYRQQSRRLLADEINLFYQGLADIPGLKVYLPTVNFILIDITGTGMMATNLRKAMMENKVLIRDCSNYPGLSPFFIRVAIKQPKQNRLLLTVLRQALTK
jgi:threonine-phosphate decarboxylase